MPVLRSARNSALYFPSRVVCCVPLPEVTNDVITASPCQVLPHGAGRRVIGRRVSARNHPIDFDILDVYYRGMIRSFRCRETEKIFRREYSRRFPSEIQERAFMRLNAIDAAERLEDLRLPPSNQLEALRGDRKGQHSVRVNQRWRICFRWRDGNAEQVEIVDYH